MRLAAALPGALVLLLAAPARAQLWTDATADTIGTTAEWTNKVELADLDGDGWVDLLFANGGDYATAGDPEPQRVFRNLGNWSAAAPYFEEITADVAGATPRLSRVIKVGDVDGDGDLDVFVGGAHGTASGLYTRGAGGAYADASASLPAGDVALGDAELGDVDGDGDLDLVLADWGADVEAGGRTRLWRNDGGVFTDATDARMPDVLVAMSWDLELVDVDDDADLDVLVSCKLCTGGRLFENDGAGAFTDVTDGRLPQRANNYEYEPMDVDGDGDLDLATINDGGQLRETVLLNDGGVFVDATATWLPGDANPGEDDNTATFVDYDDDGDADLLIGSLSGADRVLRNSGAAFEPVAGAVTVSTPGTLGVALADLDGDGRADMVQGQGETATPEKVLLATDAIAPDASPPVVRVLRRASAGAPEVVVRVHDRRSPSRPHDWGAVVVEIVSSQTTDPLPMRWRGEYLWAVAVPADDPALRYRVCATDRAGNQQCTPALGVGDPPDAGVDVDAAGPGGEDPGDGGGGGSCGAGGGPAGPAALTLVALVALRKKRQDGERRRG